MTRQEILDYYKLKEDPLGWITDAEGLNASGLFNYIWCDVLNYCACGNPEEVVINFLVPLLNNLNNLKWPDYSDYKTMYALYSLDSLGYLEHGTTIRGSWLSEKGKIFLEQLKYFIEELEDEETEK